MGWKEKTLFKIAELIKEVVPDVTVEMKYKKATNPDGVPVWYFNGMICTGETYKNHLRLTFSKGSLLKDQDPKGLLNLYRSMVIEENDKLDEAAFKNLIKSAVSLNKK